MYVNPSGRGQTRKKSLSPACLKEDSEVGSVGDLGTKLARLASVQNPPAAAE